VLDFGLAKALAGDSSAVDLSRSPTMTATMGGTREGVILGTAAYMSPEQARGKVLDKRADIWSFGCVLFEMLTGRPVFGGDTLSDTIAAVLTVEVDLDALSAEVPPSGRRLLRRCFEREPRKRLRDLSEALLQIEEEVQGLLRRAVTVGEPVPGPTPGRYGSPPWRAWSWSRASSRARSSGTCGPSRSAPAMRSP